VNIQYICQCLIAIHFVLIFFTFVRSGFHGSKQRPPGGFSGFVGTLITIGCLVALNYGAGSFSLLAK